MNNLHRQFKSARNVGTPLIAVSSADAESTMQGLQALCNGAAIVQWDSVCGYQARNDAGVEALAVAYNDSGVSNEEAREPVPALEVAAKMPSQPGSGGIHWDGVVVFFLNGHSYVESDYTDRRAFIQGVWNLRDPFKSSKRTAVLLGPSFSLPVELQQDVLVLEEPLPNDIELAGIVNASADAFRVSTGAKFSITKQILEKAVDALRGLAAFPAEQAVAMCLSKTGLDVEGLWERKRQLISQTDGLSIYNGPESFQSAGGCEQVKQFMRGVIGGEEAPRVIIFIDEGEKAFSGGSSDFTGDGGVAKDALGVTLQYMEDHEADGAIFVGPPGAAKSLIAQAMGNEASIPTIILDLGGTRGGIVGDSEKSIRKAYKVIDAVGGGRVYFIMTCNKIAVLPPELKRRFTSGIFYFEIPDAQSGYKDRTERDLIWPIYLKKYGLDPAQVSQVKDEGWTGAEIRNCCRLAFRQKLTLAQASQYIIPVSKSAPEQIANLRSEANGRYLSANHEGVYQYTFAARELTQPSTRSLAGSQPANRAFTTEEAQA